MLTTHFSKTVLLPAEVFYFPGTVKDAVRYSAVQTGRNTKYKQI
jgi:hypothetical protein